jgi:hypothetical protein
MITETTTHFYGHGEMWLGDAVAGGMPSSFDTPVVDIDALEFTLTAEYIEHVSKRTSIAKKHLKVLKMISGTGKITCSSHSLALLKKYLYASQTTVTGGSFSATAFAKALAAVGDYLPLPGGKTKVSSLVVTDSNGSPATLALGTDYEADADAGVIKILSLGAYTQPFKAAGTEAAGTALNLFQSTPALQGMRAKAINLADDGEIETLDIPMIQISPAAGWQRVNDGNEPNKYEIEFEILNDDSNSTYPFGKLRQ